MLINDIALLLDLFRNSEGTKLLIWTVTFCLVFTVTAKWRVELRAKIGQYRNRCLVWLYRQLQMHWKQLQNLSTKYSVVWPNCLLLQTVCQETQQRWKKGAKMFVLPDGNTDKRTGKHILLNRQRRKSSKGNFAYGIRIQKICLIQQAPAS